MPSVLLLPLYMRLASSALFFGAVIYAAIENRSLLLVPLLALASTLTHWSAAKLFLGPLKQVALALGAKPQQIKTFGLARIGFVAGILGYSIVFMVFVFLSALVQSTELERSLQQFDAVLIAVPCVLAFLLAWFRDQFTAVPDLPESINDNDPEAFIIEGELNDNSADR